MLTLAKSMCNARVCPIRDASGTEKSEGELIRLKQYLASGYPRYDFMQEMSLNIWQLMKQ